MRRFLITMIITILILLKETVRFCSCKTWLCFCVYLDRATDPSMKEEDWDKITAFCDRVNAELEGPLLSTRLLAHKIQSPQEKEALFALTVSIYFESLFALTVSM